MAIAFVHLSDIHFGQEKGGRVIVHDDVKERLIEDVVEVVRELAAGPAAGVIVTGDIAYAGKKDEYKAAGNWLDRVAAAAGCEKTDIQVVPGNHDIDRAEISPATEMMLAEIAAHGEDKLDAFLASDRDREMLYGRFAAYRPFAEGYDCPLDGEGGLAGDCTVQLAPGRRLRFIGLNSALICAKRDEEGRLLLGARQRVLPRTAGEEVVVLAHHPLHWLQDSKDARRYVRSRARVFISGHEHNPAVHVEPIKEGCDLMMLAAGATVPPAADETFNFTYNILEFGWDEGADALSVTVHPRAWSDEDKEFVDDPVRLGGHVPTFKLGCPNFRRALVPQPDPAADAARADQSLPEAVSTASESDTLQEFGGETVSDPFPLLLLRFFRDLSPGQRLSVLVKLGALPDDWSGSLTHALERRVIDGLARNNRLAELEAAITDIEREQTAPGGHKT